MNRLVFITLWILVFSIPWANVLVFEWAGTITRIIGIAAFSIGAIYVVATGRIRRLRLIHLLIAAFVVWAIFSFFWSIDHDRTLQRAWTYVQLAAMVWLIWQFARTEANVRALMQAYVLGAYISIASTVANFITGQQADFLRYAASGFGPNDLGMILTLGIPISWYLSTVNRGQLISWLYRLYTPFAVIAILLTGSRTAFAAAIFAMLIIPWTLNILSTRGKAVLLVVSFASIALACLIIPTSIWERIAGIPAAISQGDLSLREDLWLAGIGIFSEHPVQGVGAGAFGQAIAPVLGSQHVAHNTFLSILAENGIIGFALLLLIGFLFISFILKMRLPERKLWLILLGCWILGAFFLSWEHRHPTWLLISLLCTHAFALSGISTERFHAVEYDKLVTREQCT